MYGRKILADRMQEVNIHPIMTNKKQHLELHNMKTTFIIRVAQQSDLVELKDLFQETVLVINRRNYSLEEVEDWASCGDDLSKLGEMVKTHYFIVAVDRLSQIVGFSSLTLQGYLHYYVCSQRLSG